MQNFDPAALDCLAALVDQGSFERAAQQLAITQSAVSQRLKSLESQAGQALVVRSRPLRLTDAGRVLLRFARQLQALRADVALELGEASATGQRLAIAVNADSLATWVPPALDALVQGGLALELVVDDQDFTHDWLRQGAVLGCVSSVAQALRGCRVVPLGAMRYLAVVSPAFLARHLGGDAAALNRINVLQLPFLVFNRKDDMQRQWVTQAFGIRAPRLDERFVPSSEAYVRAALLGWGIGVAPELQVRELVRRGELLVLRPDATVDVRLYWHQWMLGDVAPAAATEAPQGGAATLQRVGQALAAGAAGALASALPGAQRADALPRGRAGAAASARTRAAPGSSRKVARAPRKAKG